MTDQEQLYYKPERKRELVEQLAATLQEIRTASRNLEEKAWELLKVSSATFGAITALVITLNKNAIGGRFLVAFVIVFISYLWQIAEVYQAIKPRQWRYVPGVDKGTLDYVSLVHKYVPYDDNEYLDRLIVDYAGKDEDGIHLPGAIEITQAQNQEKAEHVRRAGLLLGAIVSGLIVMAALTAV